MVFPHPLAGDSCRATRASSTRRRWKGIVLFLIVNWVARNDHWRTRNRAVVTGVFLIGYALARIAVEFVRQYDPQLGLLFGASSPWDSCCPFP